MCQDLKQSTVNLPYVRGCADSAILYTGSHRSGQGEGGLIYPILWSETSLDGLITSQASVYFLGTLFGSRRKVRGGEGLPWDVDLVQELGGLLSYLRMPATVAVCFGSSESGELRCPSPGPSEPFLPF